MSMSTVNDQYRCQQSIININGITIHKISLYHDLCFNCVSQYVIQFGMFFRLSGTSSDDDQYTVEVTRLLYLVLSLVKGCDSNFEVNILQILKVATNDMGVAMVCMMCTQSCYPG